MRGIWQRNNGRHGRGIPALAFAALLGGLATSGNAQAIGSVSGGTHRPLEQRVAVALGPERTSVWTQLRVDSDGGPMAIIMPAPVGATLDWSSAAWMEALEEATAVRILAPAGEEPACPGETPGDGLHVAGDLDHTPPLAPEEELIHADADAVVTWAESHNMQPTAELYAALNALQAQQPDMRFFAARFVAPAGEALTPALRVVLPGVDPSLAFDLSQAGQQPLMITAFSLGEGNSELDGPSASLAVNALSFDAAEGDSNYRTLRGLALKLVAGSSMLEASGRATLSGDLSIGGDHSIRGLVDSYFERAATYGEISGDAASCIQASETALAQAAALSASCARADLGVVDGVDSCQEMVGNGEIDPLVLRCGELADDLAVALSGQQLDQVKLSRHSLRVDDGASGVTRTFGSSNGSDIEPLLTAASLDLSGCDGGGGSGGGSGSGGASGSGGSSGSGSGSGAGSGSGGATSYDVPVYRVDNGCGSREVGEALYTIAVLVDNDEEPPDAYYEEEDCSGSPSDSYAVYQDDNGGETYGDGFDNSGSDCSGDSYDSGDSSYDNGDSGCSGDSYDNGDSSASSGDDCGGDSYDDGDYNDSGCSSDSGDGSDSSGDSCGSDSGSSDSDSCAIARRPRRRRPRLSMLIVAAFALLTPLRRWSRPRPRRVV